VIERSLDGSWQLRESGTAEWLDATVPGGVHLELMAAGRISDPFVADEELRVQWVAERDWEYRCEFTVDADVLAQQRSELVFDGLDTFAAIELNGEPLGRADNMFRSWRFDVTGRLRLGINEIAVTFESAVRRGAEMDGERHLDSANDQLPGAPHLRKAPCHFGWDWGPKLPNIGFWQGVRLQAWSGARFADVRIAQSIEGGQARISARGSVEEATPGAAASLSARLRVTRPGGGAQGQTQSAAPRLEFDLGIDVTDPELWWPNGLGDQPLYQVDVELFDGDRVLDTRAFRVGLRRLALRRDKDEWGESFEFVVNGVPVFAKGTNWIPADSFPARATPAVVAGLLESAAAANHNMIRVWGGGYYETEAFYDACDRLGILVWQDMMFACSVYPLDRPDFIDSVRAEVREQVRRLRHRACLAVWCGNNELEIGWPHWGWDRPEYAELKAAWLRFFVDDLPSCVAAEDPATPYWFGSPSSGRPLEEPPSDRSGDYHEWTVWHALEPFESYTKEHYRFVSEFGFESMPAMATIEAFAPDPADWNTGSPLLDHHQRCSRGNARILAYMSEQFRLPHDFESIVYLSQILQAEAMRVGVEHWRRDRARCGGALYWQLNDCWPVSSWSSIDYFGRWKALHYASRRFFDPVLLSVRVEGDAAALWVVNDTAAPVSGEIRWSLERLDGYVASAGTAPVSGAGVSATFVASILLPASIEERRVTVVVAEFLVAGRRRALVVTPLAPDKHMALTRADIDWSVEAAGSGAGSQAAASGAVVRLKSDTLARWVEITLEGADVVLSDNYFDLPAGREVTVSFDLPDGWDLERARAAVRIKSVADTYL